jgi:hypothetical protein
MRTKATWSIVVVYENPEIREPAVTFCDGLTKRFWDEFDFDVSWWSFDLLQSEQSAKEAAEKVAGADLVVFAAGPEGEVPRHVGSWVESCLRRRGDREGTLVGLFGQGEDDQSQRSDKHFYLRRLAHKSGMDYLTQIPQGIAHPIPETLESYTERAEQVTGVLDEILHQPPPPVSLR